MNENENKFRMWFLLDYVMILQDTNDMNLKESSEVYMARKLNKIVYFLEFKTFAGTAFNSCQHIII